MAPEIFITKSYTQKADIFSLGIVLFTLYFYFTYFLILFIAYLFIIYINY